MKPRNQFWSISDVKKRKRRNRDILERSQKQFRPEFDSDKFFVGLLVREPEVYVVPHCRSRSRLREALHSLSLSLFDAAAQGADLIQLIKVEI